MTIRSTRVLLAAAPCLLWSRRDGADPADRITLDDRVSYALMVVLEQLSPAERTAWVTSSRVSTGASPGRSSPPRPGEARRHQAVKSNSWNSRTSGTHRCATKPAWSGCAS